LDKEKFVRNRTILAMLVSSLLLGLSPLSANSVIQHGIDVFTTVGGGRTFYDFAQNPIPAGFFCKKSKAFTGRVAFKGLPLATEIPGQLRNADTVIERLDDSVFDAKGTAVTRLQFRALSLVSIAPIKTACGDFHVYVSLGSKQRTTTMNISLTQQGGGEFVAPLAVDVRLTFIPVKPARNKARALELEESFTFPAIPIPWSFAEEATAKKIGRVFVDTNGDLTPDTLLPGTSNFSPGLSPNRPNRSMTDKSGGGCGLTCHADVDKQHCYTNPPPPYCLDTPEEPIR
jgi:hypothetical protein